MTKILVIDDEPNFVALTKTMLEKEGYEVLGATNGIEGVAIAVAEQPDLILLDVLMPQIGGVKVLKHLRKNESTAHIPIVIVTAAIGRAQDAIQDMDEPGPEDIVAKPFALEELLASMRSVLGSD